MFAYFAGPTQQVFTASFGASGAYAIGFGAFDSSPPCIETFEVSPPSTRRKTEAGAATRHAVNNVSLTFVNRNKDSASFVPLTVKPAIAASSTLSNTTDGRASGALTSKRTLFIAKPRTLR